MAYDLLIRNGTVIDGTGASRYQADVAVADHADVTQEPIVELGQRGALPAPREPPAQLPPRLPE